MTINPIRLPINFVALLAFLFAVAGSCHAQSLSGNAQFSTRCNVSDLFAPASNLNTDWQPMADSAFYITPKTRCWLKVTSITPAAEQIRTVYLVLQRSPLVDLMLFDEHGKDIARSTHNGTSHAVTEIGRRVLLPMDKLSAGPLFIRIDSSNSIFEERVVNKGFNVLPDAVTDQQNILTGTIFAATLLLTSALFTASFGLALRDLDFGIYALYTFALGITLLAWDQVNLPMVGIDYGWVWQITVPISTATLCWLAIRLGKFHKHSILVSRSLIAVMAFNLLLLFWALVALAGIPVVSMPFHRLNFENWQDVVMGALIMAGGYRGWKRGDVNCLMLFLALTPSMFIDMVNRLWDPAVAPYLQSYGYGLPQWLDRTIHFNSTLSWIALPLVFCIALARRSMLLHTELTDERKRLEERVTSRTHELHIANKELQLLATTDSLTGLPNRRSMMEWIQREIERAGDTEKPLALCMIDVDHFKKINDTYGHATGDQAIIAIANACSEIIRKTDIAARFGGEEFVLLMPETDLGNAKNVAERLRAAIEALIIKSDNHPPFGMTISIGLALFDRQSGTDTMSSLLNRADNALYQAKSAGRNQVVFA